MKHTNHLLRRCQQRGIKIDMAEIIVEFGREEKAPGGAQSYMLGKKEASVVEAYLKKLLNEVEKAKGVKVIVADSDNLITAYHARS